MKKLNIETMLGYAEEKKPMQKEKELHEFYILSNEKGCLDFIKKQGEKLVYKGITFYIDKREKGWNTTEERTGSSFAVNKATKREAIEYTKDIINKIGVEKLNNKIEKMVIRNTREVGLNPLLAGEDIPKYSEEEQKAKDYSMTCIEYVEKNKLQGEANRLAVKLGNIYNACAYLYENRTVEA